MANPYLIRCSKVPDEQVFHVDPLYGSDVPENGIRVNEDAWKTLDYAIGQVNSYGATFGACNVIIEIRAMTGTAPGNTQTLTENIRAKRIRFVSLGGIGTGAKTRLVINNNNPTLFLDCVFQGFMICSDFQTLGGLITFENCDFRVTQNVHNCDYRLVDVDGGNVFNISDGYAIMASDSTIRDDNTIYNWVKPDSYPQTPPVNNYANAFYVCQYKQDGNWSDGFDPGERDGCTQGTMAIGYYRQSGATYSAHTGQILGFLDGDLNSPVPIDYLENQKMESLDLQDYAPDQDTMSGRIYRIGRFVFTSGGQANFGNPVSSGASSTGLIPLPERFRPPMNMNTPSVRGDNHPDSGLITIFGSDGYITLNTWGPINDNSGWNRPPVSWIVDKSTL
jgi:hypothetical protein